MKAFDRKRCDARLLSLLDHKANKQLTLFALVIVFVLPLNLGIKKSARLINISHRFRIRRNQPSAEPSRRTECSTEDLQSASQQFRVEIVVPCDFYPHTLLAFARLNIVSDHF